VGRRERRPHAVKISLLFISTIKKLKDEKKQQKRREEVAVGDGACWHGKDAVREEEIQTPTNLLARSSSIRREATAMKKRMTKKVGKKKPGRPKRLEERASVRLATQCCRCPTSEARSRPWGKVEGRVKVG